MKATRHRYVAGVDAGSRYETDAAFCRCHARSSSPGRRARVCGLVGLSSSTRSTLWGVAREGVMGMGKAMRLGVLGTLAILGWTGGGCGVQHVADGIHMHRW